MKGSAATLVLAGLAAGFVAPGGKVAFSAQQLAASSAPNAVSMATLKGIKIQQREDDRAAGLFDVDRYAATGAAPCVSGKAGEYSCRNVNLAGFLRHQDMGSVEREGNDVWAWTSSTGREFGLVGQTDGTAFVEVLKDGSLQYLGRLPTQTVASTWRDIKVLGNHAYIGAEAANHGLQIFDLTKLLTLSPASPKTFSTTSDLTALYAEFGSSHNIVVHDGTTKTVSAVGTGRNAGCNAGLWMVDVSNPSKPKKAGCVGEDGYVHDAQCVIYSGPDQRYKGREVCFNYNEDTLTIVDVTDRASPKQLSRTTYKGATYTHQGWLADKEMRYLLLDDELDESRKTGPAADQKTTTYIVDIINLTKPVFTGVYKSPAKSIDHNQYVLDGLSYQSNYGSGLRIVNVSSVAQDPTGAGFKEVGFFDVHPADDAVGGEATFHGAWSVYPYLKSGYILINSIERGVYSVKYASVSI
ncbi:hypothetical protein CCM_05658 [Cordyceps militaris CM01]|uniref:Uncharacterized protein n=1 Tax=Cordyceps militaris (strain CM01) TaxID=983644 RepID=G3JKR1_CORMM|nr:uncharacterized protein CCM_05658 [Cordyceps militaris CM01]EGX91500.1 hypothetical protein CCM_05658 [Cordyceps militaris CM01]